LVVLGLVDVAVMKVGAGPPVLRAGGLEDVKTGTPATTYVRRDEEDTT
jgi:hypothetical protein